MHVRSRLHLLFALVSSLNLPLAVAHAHEPTLTAPAVVESPPVTRPRDVSESRAVRVLLQVQLDPTGQVREAQVVTVEPSGSEDAAFVAAAQAYVRTVHFSPASDGTNAVASSVRFEVVFAAEPLPAPAPAFMLADAATPTTTSDAGVAQTHVHPHAHEVVHTHAHDSREPHDQDELGASALIARPERSASSYTLDRKDLPRGAHVLPADLVRNVPGMFVVQHAGGGKANQYFLRGFDADHGTDVALSVDGVPVNMVSHGHGQGYADLNFVIPELIETVAVRKGSYDPRDGDFATAGAIDFQTGTKLQNRVTVEGGMFHSYRALALVGTQWSDLKITGAAELTGTDGPFKRGEDLKRVNLFARAASQVGSGELSLTMTGYVGGWNASGQIPLREVRAGRLDRFGNVDPYEGGNSSRHNLYLRYRTSPEQRERWDVLAYATLYRFSLYSDFTFFRDDPVDGDMIHQRDQRTMTGAKARYERDDSLGPFRLTSRFGFDLRSDRIDNGLDRAPRNEWAATLVDARIDQSSAGTYVEEEVEWTRWLRTTGGVRADAFLFHVDSGLEDRDTLGTRSSGEKMATRVSPKGSVTLTPLRWLSLYGNYGLGFHSNDARGVVTGVTPLTRADGYEVGLSLKLLERVRARFALFRVDLDSELVWVGDEGTTEASGATRRQGFETDVRVDILPWLWADASMVLTQARFRDVPSAESQVPLAPRRLITGKLTAMHPAGPFGRLMLMHLGDRPATEDGVLTAQGFTRLDLSLGYHHPRFEVAMALENLLNVAWRESQFANSSRLRNESGPASCMQGSRAVSESGNFVGCEDMHFTPGTPVAFRASGTLFF